MNRDNQLLQPVTCQAEAVILTSQETGQQALAFTITHPAGETTVFLSRDQAITWRDMLDAKTTKMTGLVMPTQAIPPFGSFPAREDYRHPNGGHPR